MSAVWVVEESMKMTDSEHGGDSSDFIPFWESIFKKYLLNGESILLTFYFPQISTNCTYQIPGFLVQTDKRFLLDIRLTILSQNFKRPVQQFSSVKLCFFLISKRQVNRSLSRGSQLGLPSAVKRP